MALHLIKLAVGCESVADLGRRVEERVRTAGHHFHVTRMVPKRDDELLDGGSLYWVIRGEVAARQRILAIEPFRDGDGIGRCRISLQSKVHAVAPRAMRPFQGWRYLLSHEAPLDLGRRAANGLAAMPEPMRRELRELGLI